MKRILRLLMFIGIMTGLVAFSGVCSFASLPDSGSSDSLTDYGNDLICVDESIGDDDEFWSDGPEYDPENDLVKIPVRLNEYEVMLNGDYVEFTDAAPVNKNGRIMVPFRVILETLGAEIGYEPETKTISAKLDDIEITFEVGKTDINITKNGEKSVKKMDVVPYIDSASNRTYVSTRFVAESLEYTVGWDSDEKTVVIMDVDKIFEGADKNFTKVDGYLKASQPQKDVVYEQTINAAMGLVVYKDVINLLAGEDVIKNDIDFKVNVEGDSLSKNNEIGIDAVIKMNLEDLIPLISNDEQSKEDMALIKNMETFEFKAYSDIESGDVYFTTNNNALFSENADESTWFKINIYKVYESLGMDIKDVVNDSISGNIVSMEALINSIKKSMLSDISTTTYYELTTIYDAINAVASDKAVKVKKSGKETVYTIDLSNLDNFAGYQGSKGKVVIKEKDGVYTCNTDFKMAVLGFMNFNMNFDTKLSVSDKEINKVPDGANIVDLSSEIEKSIVDSGIQL